MVTCSLPRSYDRFKLSPIYNGVIYINPIYTNLEWLNYFFKLEKNLREKKTYYLKVRLCDSEIETLTQNSSPLSTKGVDHGY